jgi:hypothetical protein
MFLPLGILIARADFAFVFRMQSPLGKQKTPQTPKVV